MTDHALTAAHRSLPFGTKVRVTHSKSGKTVVVTITDRGPFVRGRIIDLAPAAARLLGISGLAPVIIAIGNPEPEQLVELGIGFDKTQQPPMKLAIVQA